MGASHSSADKLQLYYDPCSANSLRVIMYMIEAGLPFELIKLDLNKGEHQREEFVKVNPRMQVPFLVQGTVRMNESIGIIDYLGRIYPNEHLFPTKDREGCALNCRLIAEFHQKLDPLSLWSTVVWRNKTRSQIGEDRIQNLFKELQIWEDYLAQENDYFLGNHISTSDIIVFPFIAVHFGYLVCLRNASPSLPPGKKECESVHL